MSDWIALRDELDRWDGTGLRAEFWWRDDDAVTDSDSLDLLLRRANGIPLAVAAIPGLADETLAARLANEPLIAVLQHGWRHHDYAGTHPHSEYPAGRDPMIVLAELRRGGQALRSLFGAQALPVFVPPWHGFDDSYLPLLPEAGLKGFSRRGPRRGRTIHGMIQTNVHCVPIQWTMPRTFGDGAIYLRQICVHLEGRRTGAFDLQEATGILTHHLVQDEASYTFMSRLAEMINSHPAARWIEIRDVFPFG